MHTIELCRVGNHTLEPLGVKEVPSKMTAGHPSGEDINLNGSGTTIIRALTASLYFAKNHAKLLLDLWQRVEVLVLRAFGVIDFPVPPNSLMRATSSKTIRHFYESGIRSLMPVVDAAAMEGADLSRQLTVMDFGCGVGRILLPLSRLYPNLALHACDVNSRVVKYVRNAFPDMIVTMNRFRPPLAYPADTFDWVYSISIFSHLSVEDQRSWLHELARVLKSGGLCSLTIMGPHAVDHWQDMTTHEREAARSALAQEGVYYNGCPKPEGHQAAERISSFGSNLVGIDESYGDTFYTEDYVRRHWDNKDFELRRYRSGVIDDLQDLVVLRKR